MLLSECVHAGLYISSSQKLPVVCLALCRRRNFIFENKKVFLVSFTSYNIWHALECFHCFFVLIRQYLPLSYVGFPSKGITQTRWSKSKSQSNTNVDILSTVTNKADSEGPMIGDLVNGSFFEQEWSSDIGGIWIR